MDKEYELIIFDLDNTLVNYSKAIDQFLYDVYNFLGKKISDQDMLNWYNFENEFWSDFENGKLNINIDSQDPNYLNYIYIYRFYIFFKGISFDLASKLNEIYMSALSEYVYPMDGVYETLDYLKDRYSIAIGTNGPLKIAAKRIEKIGCLDFINYIFTADTTKKIYSKPQKEFYESMLAFIGEINKEKILMVGDSLVKDVNGAQNVGIDGCWYNPYNKENLTTYQPTLTINHLNELKRIL